MDVTGLALRATAARPRVLLAAVPGGAAVRLAAERLLRLRDWPQVPTPAEADLLLVAGPDCPGLQGALERLWQDLPAPRARVHARGADQVEAALDTGRALLGAPAVQHGVAAPPAEAGGRQEGEHGPQERHEGDGKAPGPARGNHPGGGGAGGGHGEDGPADDAHGGPDGEHAQHEGGQDMADHGDGGHGGGQMEMPGGLPMAEQGADRDGLALDQLHVPLGPFLADWPTGLTIRLVLQGDVIQQADLDEPATPVGIGAVEPFWVQPWLRAAAGEPVPVGEAVRRRAAARLDSLGRLLAVAGWPAEAVAARRLRDDLLSGAPGAAVTPRLERLARRVGRSWTLAWLTRGLGVVTVQKAREAGVSGPAARAGGDVTARYRQWLTDIRHDLLRLEDSAPLDAAVEESPRGHWSAERPPSAALIALLPGLLEGAELAAARLIVAGLDPDPDELAVRAGKVARD
ncbi:hypothetical protein [Streptomyces sp. TRM70350]|uniref:hypothetical protein n=1 Tax=Streptomyces sp. TRM70350 TaxID=2856165 RepID=UPI001C45C10B|nr:hypothetical protein [Streptomyces sp. TRM70350]MBV7695721.1 hypothetical protein [Streptomyces sp. TRM70350]